MPQYLHTLVLVNIRALDEHISLKLCLHANCHLIKKDDEVYVVKNRMHMHFHEEALHLFLSAPVLYFCSSPHLSSSSMCLVLGWLLSGFNVGLDQNIRLFEYSFGGLAFDLQFWDSNILFFFFEHLQPPRNNSQLVRLAEHLQQTIRQWKTFVLTYSMRIFNEKSSIMSALATHLHLK